MYENVLENRRRWQELETLRGDELRHDKSTLPADGELVS